VPFYAHALTGQYPWDPLYFKVEPTQNYQNDLIRQRLVSQYGSSAFNQCYSCLYQDTSNPHTETRCLNAAEYCLQSSQRFQGLFQGLQDISKNMQKSAPINTETPDELCKKSFGQNSYSTGITNNQNQCDCLIGYDWNQNRTVCVKKEIQCPSNSFISGGVCQCNAGYVWNESKTECTKIITPYESCKNTYGQYSYYTNKSDDNGRIICDCMSGYEWNATRTSCVQKATPKVDTTPSISPSVLGEKISNQPSTSKKISCSGGYTLSLDKTTCVKIPQHAHIVQSPTDVWLCDDGYQEVGNKCILVDDSTLDAKKNIIPLTNAQNKSDADNQILGNNQGTENQTANDIAGVKTVNPITSFFNNLFLKLSLFFK